MKKLLLSFFLSLATCALWAGNVAYYTASSKLTEVTDPDKSGFLTTQFNTPMISHEFAAGKGTLTFYGELTSIGMTVTNTHTLTTFTLPNSVKRIGRQAFYNCRSLDNFDFPDSLTTLGDQAFIYCESLHEAILPNTIDSLGKNIFSYCPSLESVTLPKNIDMIPESMFTGCKSLTHIDIPSTVSELGDYAFMHCMGLDSIALPDGLLIIGRSAFENCTTLTSFKVPSKVSYIGINAFSGCSNIKTLTCEAVTPPRIDNSNTFDDVSKTIPLLVPAKSVDKYKAATGWKDFFYILPIPESPVVEDPNNKIVTYTSSAKLNETLKPTAVGLHVTEFNTPIIQHVFEVENGTIEFFSELTDLGTTVYNDPTLYTIDSPLLISQTK